MGSRRLLAHAVENAATEVLSWSTVIRMNGRTASPRRARW
jgi:hypothetical protein